MRDCQCRGSALWEVSPRRFPGSWSEVVQLRLCLLSGLRAWKPSRQGRRGEGEGERERACVYLAAAATAAIVVVWLEGGMKICGGTVFKNLFHVFLSENRH